MASPLKDKRLTRRKVLAGMSVAAAGAVVAGCATAAPTATAVPTAGPAPTAAPTAQPTAITQTGKWANGIRVRFFAGGAAGDIFAGIVYKGAQYAEADLGCKLEGVFSDWDPGKMVDSLRDAVAAKPDAICFMGHAGDDATMPLAKQAKEAGIVMTYVNVDLPKVREAYGGGYIGANTGGQSEMLAQRAIKKYGLKQGDKVIILGFWNMPGLQIRYTAQEKVYTDAGIQVIKLQDVEGSQTDQGKLTPIITGAVLRDPDVKLISYSGGQALAAADIFMKALNKKPGEIKNTGFDLSPSILTGIGAGYIDITTDQQPFLQGYLPVLSVCLTKRFFFEPLSFDTGRVLIDGDNYKPLVELVKQGIR